jgi:serine/threonine protein kinase
LGETASPTASPTSTGATAYPTASPIASTSDAQGTQPGSGNSIDRDSSGSSSSAGAIVGGLFCVLVFSFGFFLLYKRSPILREKVMIAKTALASSTTSKEKVMANTVRATSASNRANEEKGAPVHVNPAFGMTANPLCDDENVHDGDVGRPTCSSDKRSTARITAAAAALKTKTATFFQSTQRTTAATLPDFVADPSWKTGKLAKKGTQSVWTALVFAFDPKSNVLSWMKNDHTSHRIGHMLVKAIFQLPERAGKRRHRFDLVGVVVTSAQELRCLKVPEGASNEEIKTLQEKHNLLMQYEASADEIVNIFADSDAIRTEWVHELAMVGAVDERPLSAHPSYKLEWAAQMLDAQLKQANMQLKAATAAQKFEECTMLKQRLEQLTEKRTQANQLIREGTFNVAEKREIIKKLEALRLQMEDSSSLGLGSAKWVHAMRQWEVSADQIEKFEVLGKGGFGSVKRAKCFGVICVVKEINTSTPAEEIFASKLLQKESRALSKLHHPNVIRLLHVCTDRKALCIVLELAERGSLRALLDAEPGIPLWRRFGFVFGITSGMSCLHRQKPPIVHHDLKPDNVLVTSEYTAKITDFGTATGTRSTQGATTTIVGAGGTPQYQPPEVLNNTQSHDGRPVDVYAWAITVYETISGKQAWPRMSQEQVLVAVLNKKQRPVWEPSPTKELCEMVDLAWQHAPDERPSFQELIDKCTRASQASKALRPPRGATDLHGRLCVVVSTSETTILGKDGKFDPNGKFEEVMNYIEGVSKISDNVIFGYDWAGSSTSDTRDAKVDFSDKVAIAASYWFKGYCERIKAEVRTAARHLSCVLTALI